MGKQRRKKNNKKKNNTGNIPLSDKGVCSSASSSSLVNKIRHGEAKVRHAALSALSSTMFSPEFLSKSKSIKLELIQAMAERIMDEDVPCALCATGCIANYILFQENSDDKKSTIDDNKLEIILVPILLRKMDKACDQIKLYHEQMVNFASIKMTGNDVSLDKNQTKNNKTALKQLEQKARMLMDQFSLMSLSLHALCGLVEIFSINDSSSSLLHHQRDQFLSTTMKSFVISNEMIKSLAASATSSNEVSGMNPSIIVNKMIAKNENESNIISDVVVYAARIIHSASDDNSEFIKTLLSSETFFDVITSSISNASLPTLARLHSVGTVIILRQYILDLVNHDSSAAKLKSSIDSTLATDIFPLLSSCTTYSADISSALCNQISIMERKLREEREDEKLENDVMKMAEKRKESARLIAKRQKEMKAATKTEEEKSQMNQDSAMHEDVDVKSKDGHGKEQNQNDKSTHLEETDFKYEKAITAWKNACLPLKLSIEVIANMCADRTGEDQNDTFDQMIDDEMGWDSDQEEKLLSSTPKDLSEKKNRDAELFNNIISCGIPDQVLSVFGCVILSLSNSKRDQIPRVALVDLFEVLAKCGVCLGNIVGNLDHWKSNEADISSVWKEFFQCLTSAVNGEATYENLMLPCQAISTLLSTMTVFLNFRPVLVKSVNEQDLNLLLSYAKLEAPLNIKQSSTQSDRDDMEALSDIQKDSINVLGTLCSEPHPDEINDQICTVFLTLLNRSHSITAPLMSELLNVLMDMYSADEGDPNNHESIFRKNNVVGVFEKSIPVLKRKIREAIKPSPIDTAFWKETALNATRFVKYKKG